MLNVIVTLSVFLSSVYSIVVCIESLGIKIAPALYDVPGFREKRWPIMVTGVLGIMFSIYSGFINPVFVING